jgi:arylsulfatase A-like enzyme
MAVLPDSTSEGWRGRPPVILLISVDTLRADHLQIYGFHRSTSPRLESIIKNGEWVIFEKAVSSAPWTLPSHMSMMIGLLPSGHRVDDTDLMLSEDIVTLAESLQKLGYHTLAFTDGGFVSGSYGFGRGFDTYYENARWDRNTLGLFERVNNFLSGHNGEPILFSFTPQKCTIHTNILSHGLAHF